MQYRLYTGKRDDLTAKITQLERTHYRMTLERSAAEVLKADEDILKIDKELKTIETTLEPLYAELDSLTKNG